MHEEKGEIRQLLIHGKNNWQKRKNKEWGKGKTKRVRGKKKIERKGERK